MEYNTIDWSLSFNLEWTRGVFTLVKNLINEEWGFFL
jgi:hypothetical protein